MGVHERRERTDQGSDKAFAVAILRLIDTFDRRTSLKIVAWQLGKSASSIGANYHAACTGRSRPEWLSKMQTSNEESDEAVYWLEVLTELGTVDSTLLPALTGEARQLRAIIRKTLGTARRNDKKENPDS
jgi:four helix bundle protein